MVTCMVLINMDNKNKCYGYSQTLRITQITAAVQDDLTPVEYVGLSVEWNRGWQQGLLKA